MTPPPVPAPASPADPASACSPDRPAPAEREEAVDDLFRWMSWSVAVAMNA